MDYSYLKIFKTALSLSIKELKDGKQKISEDTSLTDDQKTWVRELVEILNEWEA